MRAPGFFAIVGLSLLAGCANTSGVAEFRVYAESIDALVTASGPITDRIAAAEKQTGAAKIDETLRQGADEPAIEVNGANAGEATKGLAPLFKPQHAVYFAESGRPPYAASVDASMAALKRFNAVMLTYANGQSLESARSDVTALAGNIGAAAKAAGLSVPGVGTGLSAFLEASSVLGAAGSREAFRTILREEGGRLDALLGALIDNSDVAFTALTEELYYKRGRAAITGDDIDELTRKIKAERALISEWVLMLTDARGALASARKAVDAPRSIGGGLNDALTATAEVKLRAERIRALLAAN